MALRNYFLGRRSIASYTREGIASGAVHIRVYPRPRNLAESREILRVLEGYGEVVMYKHLKYEPQTPAPNSILAIYQSQGSAQKLISVSPFLCKLELKDSGWTYAGSEILNQVQGIDKVPEGEHGNEEEEAITGKAKQAAGGIEAEDKYSQGLSGSREWGATSQESVRTSKQSFEKQLPPIGSLNDPAMLPSRSTDNQASTSASSAATSQPTAASVREFKLWVTPSHMNHQLYIERQGYYTEFVPDRKTLMAQDFENRVPLAGMVDCRIDKVEVPLRIRNRRKERGLPEPFSIRAQWEKRHPPEPSN